MKHLHRTACALTLSLSVLLSLQAEPDKAWQNHLVKREADKPVLRYVNAKLPADESKPAVESVGYIHPLHTPGGELVTDLAPKDHPHHRGVFCAWVEVEGNGKKADFWGWGAKAPKEGCVISTESFQVLPGKPRPGDPWSLAWVASNRWQMDSTNVLNEVLTLRVRHLSGPKDELPQPEKLAPPEWQAYVVDLHYTFAHPLPVERRTGDIRLAASPFGGFCYRAKPRGKPEVTGPDGKVVTLPDAAAGNADKNWPAAQFYDLTYRSADGKKVSGVAVMNHPDNPKSTWFNHRGLHMLNPCIVAEGPVTIKDALVLKYRLVVHDGDAASLPLAKLYWDFADEK